MRVYVYIFPSPVSVEPHKIRISPRTRCGTTCYYPPSARLSPNTTRGGVAKKKYENTRIYINNTNNDRSLSSPSRNDGYKSYTLTRAE